MYVSAVLVLVFVVSLVVVQAASDPCGGVICGTTPYCSYLTPLETKPGACSLLVDAVFHFFIEMNPMTDFKGASAIFKLHGKVYNVKAATDEIFN